jgi:hypothetical protein
MSGSTELVPTLCGSSKSQIGSTLRGRTPKKEVLLITSFGGHKKSTSCHNRAAKLSRVLSIVMPDGRLGRDYVTAFTVILANVSDLRTKADQSSLTIQSRNAALS